jgi:GNAT superfamily N-acetyltransferase
MNVLIREAKKTDMKAVLGLINELAIYENEPDAVINTEENLIKDGFGEEKVYDCVVAELDQQIIGFFITYTSYSTWNGKCLYLEDLYVQEQYRRDGVGKLLFDALITEAKKRKVKRLDWQVLEWNEPAIKFYEKIGAIIDKEWYNGRMFF